MMEGVSLTVWSHVICVAICVGCIDNPALSCGVNSASVHRICGYHISRLIFRPSSCRYRWEYEFCTRLTRMFQVLFLPMYGFYLGVFILEAAKEGRKEGSSSANTASVPQDKYRHSIHETLPLYIRGVLRKFCLHLFDRRNINVHTTPSKPPSSPTTAGVSR